MDFDTVVVRDTYIIMHTFWKQFVESMAGTPMHTFEHLFIMEHMQTTSGTLQLAQ